MPFRPQHTAQGSEFTRIERGVNQISETTRKAMEQLELRHCKRRVQIVLATVHAITSCCGIGTWDSQPLAIRPAGPGKLFS